MFATPPWGRGQRMSETLQCECIIKQQHVLGDEFQMRYEFPHTVGRTPYIPLEDSTLG